MFSRFRVTGKSMEPNFHEGDYVLVDKLSYLLGAPKVGDAVVLRHAGTLMLKRIRKISGGRIYVSGDNKRYSSKIGPISKSMILGKILMRVGR